MLLMAAPVAVNAWRRRRTGRAGWKRFALRATATYASLLIVGVLGAMGYFSLQSSNKLNQRLGWMTANKPVQLATGEIVLPLVFRSVLRLDHGDLRRPRNHLASK